MSCEGRAWLNNQPGVSLCTHVFVSGFGRPHQRSRVKEARPLYLSLCEYGVEVSMKIKCKKCGEVIVVADDIVPGQHVRCPYCDEKFAYDVEKVGISGEDLRTALAECRKDKELNAYYKNAPLGARLYIALVFYGKVFRDALDKDAYVKAFAEIGGELKERDLRYLLQHEDDESMREYLSDRLAASVGRSDDPIRAGDAKGRSRFGIIRPSVPKHADVNPEVERRMAIQERSEKTRVQAEECEWRRKIIGSAVNGVIICAVLIVGWIVYLAWHDRQVQARRERLEAVQAEKEREEKEKQERDRQEAEERARQDRERAERLEREQKERVERRRIAAEDEERRKKIDEENRIREEAEKRQEEYRDIVVSLSDRELLREVTLPEKMRPGRAVRKFLCMLPVDQDEFVLYEVETDAEGKTVAVALSGEKGREQVDFQELKKRIEKTGCIFCDNEKAYFRPRKAKRPNEFQMPVDSQVFEPWNAMFGEMLPVIKKFNFRCNVFALDVFMLQKGEDAVKVTRLEPFDAVALSQFKDIVRQDLLERKGAAAMKRPIKIKRPVITVKLYDGDIVKKDARGNTYVPREFPQPKGYSNFRPHNYYDGRICNCGLCKKYRSWEDLRDEAVKQERAVAEYEVEIENARERRRNAVRVSDDEVDAILKKLRVRVVYAKEQIDDANEEEGFGAITPQVKSPEVGCASGSVTDELSAVGIARLNARLKYRSFCGIEFGMVEERIDPCNGRGGDLPTAFRHFKSYSKYGSKVFHRVAKIDLNGKITNASIDSFKKEIRQTVAVLSKKYGMTFDVVKESDERFAMGFEDQYVNVVVGGYYSNGEASFYIGFTNKQVDEQNDAIWSRHPGKDISMPSNAGLDVL